MRGFYDLSAHSPLRAEPAVGGSRACPKHRTTPSHMLALRRRVSVVVLLFFYARADVKGEVLIFKSSRNRMGSWRVGSQIWRGAETVSLLVNIFCQIFVG